MRRFALAAHVLLAVTLTAVLATAQTNRRFVADLSEVDSDIVVPRSSIVRPADRGLRAHTNHLILAQPAAVPISQWVETPSSLRAVYHLPSTGGAGVIAVVIAYDYPTAESDLEAFSSHFALPACSKASGCFRQVYANGVRPAANCSWAQEAALDIEWAHAMAPNARIILVEAASNGSTDLFHAVDVASNLVSQGGKGFGEVTMSWGFTEFSGQLQFDVHFKAPGVVYFAAIGDVTGKRNYPATSPYVVAAGGTTIVRDSTGKFVTETAWNSDSGGPSTYELRPQYQDAIVSIVGSRRGTPDLTFDANPHSGVAVYDSTPCEGYDGWVVFGGTSLSSPSLAGVANLAGHFYKDTNLELSTMYAHLGTADFRDITSGSAGGFTATKGWDFVTGIGSVIGVAGK